ncbi:hypothetical protein H8E50_06145 [bacterium]|nr:hypothetical protein [bacterium]
MAESIRPKKESMLEKRISEFCKSSEQLLAGIHEKHDNGGSAAPKRRGRKIGKE